LCRVLIFFSTRLLRAARDVQHAQSHQYRTLIENVRTDHVETAQRYIQSPEIFKRLEGEIGEECAQIVRVLEAAQILGEISPRSVDKVMSVGEKLSCRFTAALLEDHGVASEYVDVSDIIDFHIKGTLDQAFYDKVAAKLGSRLKECQAQVPVITGFFGMVPGGLLDKIGRGYTDLCAALVAVGLHAQELQVWKEVDGIFTADPRKVPTARLLAQISPAEASELTFYGSEVIHPFTMEQVIRARIPIRIKNVMNPRGQGTIIFPDSLRELETNSPGLDRKLFRTRSASVLLVDRKRPRRPTAVTLKHKILVMNVHSNRRSLSHGFFAQIFSILDKWRLSIDLISTSEVHVSMALHSEAPLYHGGGDDDYKLISHDLRGAIDELRVYGTVDIIPEMAILSLVGKQMKNMMGIAGKMFSTLGDNNVNIEMISQGWSFLQALPLSQECTDMQAGASEINISCVIEERDADRAINIIHTNLFTFLEQ
jgi:aspartate kinase